MLDAHTAPDGTRRFALTLREGRTEFLPGKRTATWGINGDYLGPTLRARRGDRIEVRVANRISEPTTLCWHGMRIPASMDGATRGLIEPDSTRGTQWTLDLPATATWGINGGRHPADHSGQALREGRHAAGERQARRRVRTAR